MAVIVQLSVSGLIQVISRSKAVVAGVVYGISMSAVLLG